MLTPTAILDANEAVLLPDHQNRIRNLRLVRTSDDIHLEGEARNYYAIQLAIRDVRRLVPASCSIYVHLRVAVGKNFSSAAKP